MEPWRLGQFAGLRPYVGTALPRRALWREGAQYQPVPARRVRGPDERLQLQDAQQRGAAYAERPQHPRRSRPVAQVTAGAACRAAAPGHAVADPDNRHATVARAAL